MQKTVISSLQHTPKSINLKAILRKGNCYFPTQKPQGRLQIKCQSDAGVGSDFDKSQRQQGSQKQIALRNPWFSVGSVFVIASFLKITCMSWLNFGEMFFTIGYLIPVGPWTPLVMAPIGAGLAYFADYLMKQKIHERPFSLWGVILLCLAFLFISSKFLARPRHQPFAPNYMIQRQAMLQQQAKARQDMADKQWSTSTPDQSAL
eukprot:TRINITY_DN1296_c0_g3_i1.p2 TRINITY_DN1296_c0_g3~~TRINITY_DN1296_c0_g3_i1.p2  ORF type:complete len:205 (-),score=13.38 TRINITY_DN1296_c0_g3_i1:428-1042(-)